MEGKMGFTSPWVSDFGATKNISCSDFVLTSLNKSKAEVPVRIHNGDKVAVKGVGSVQLPNNLDVNDVLYIPDFKWNLLYVRKITKGLN